MEDFIVYMDRRRELYLYYPNITACNVLDSNGNLTYKVLSRCTVIPDDLPLKQIFLNNLESRIGVKLNEIFKLTTDYVMFCMKKDNEILKIENDINELKSIKRNLELQISKLRDKIEVIGNEKYSK